MTHATGTFQVLSGSDDVYDETGGVRLSHASGSQAFAGDIEAQGAVHWLMLYRADKSASMVGLQRITGSIHGRRGSMVLAAHGDHDGASSRIELTIIEGSGTEELSGITGTGQLVAPGGANGTYELEYTIES